MTPSWRTLPPALAAGVVLACAPPAAAQVTAGPEFRVNTYTTGDQFFPVVHTDAGGGFRIVWVSQGQDGSGFGIFGQRYARDGTPLGAEFQVNTYTTLEQGAIGSVDVAGDDRGAFVMVWASADQDGNGWGVFGQRYDSTGARRGSEFQANTYTTGHQGARFHGSVGVVQDRAGGFVVVWDDGREVSGTDVFAQRFDAAGSRLGGEFRVNTYTSGVQWRPDIAMDARGNFVVVWSDASGHDGGGYGVFGQRFDASANPQGAEFQVNSYTTGDQSLGPYYGPAVALASDGRFVVLWDDFAGRDGSQQGVFGQRFAASGARAGGEFQVNTYTTGPQMLGQVAMDALGSFVATWETNIQDGNGVGIFGRRFTAAGAARGTEFRVNTYTTGPQFFPAVAADAAGNFTATWFSFSQDGSFYGSFGQRFGGLFPDALAVDTAGNGVLEPAETASLHPAWRNLSGAAQTFGGTLANLTGPAGPSYTITDPTAGYGTVANGAAQPCSDCYAVSVAGTRPALHWDASADEAITPDAHGQSKRWGLHVGGSFPDVSPASGFYGFIETLLHHGITGGCTPATYCPGNATTREQMAVFVLLAKEGATYAPPACVPPNVFGDVPETSPFCRWIEELAGRGVVAGCGGGNYCPTDPVTREQMAVFVLRTLDPALDPPACTTPVFDDVPATSPFCKWIEELVRRGVVTGCAPGLYCPDDPVTREQMGVFLSVTFGLTLYGV